MRGVSYKMTERDILKHISDGANYYVSMFGKAEHMEIIHKEFYSYVKPKGTEHGISIIYNVQIEELPAEKQRTLVAEMKALHMPIWLDLFASDEVFSLMFGKDKVHGQTEFALWAQIANDVLANGYPDMHPIYHYPLCRDGIMKCYTLYNQNIPVAVASIMDNNQIASLEFVATIPAMRRHGFARGVCERAIQEAFSNGAKIVTLRAIDAVAGKLYESIGFKAYNYVI